MSVRKRNKQLIYDENGIVIGRKNKHPRQFMLDAIPILAGDYPDADIPPMNMVAGMKQCIAVHLFDNLNLHDVDEVRERMNTALIAAGITSKEKRESIISEHGPADPPIKLVKNTAHGPQPMGLAGEMWVPRSIPDEAFEPPVVEEQLPDDIDDMTDAHLDQLQAQIDERRVHLARKKDLDPAPEAAGEEPEWLTVHRQAVANSLDATERKLRDMGADD
jgi:hypothetical protein